MLRPVRRARLAGGGRGADGLPRHRALAAHRRARCTCSTCRRPAASSWSGAQRPTDCAVTAEATPHHISLTDDLLAGYDAATRSTRRCATMADVEAVGRGWRTARSTPSPPTMLRMRPRPRSSRSTQAPPGMFGLETALACASPISTWRCGDVVAAMSWKPAAIAGVADRHGRADRRSAKPANITVFDPLSVGGAAGRAGEQEPQHAVHAGSTLRGKVRHTVFDGGPSVDRRRGATRSEWTCDVWYEHARIGSRDPKLEKGCWCWPMAACSRAS